MPRHEAIADGENRESIRVALEEVKKNIRRISQKGGAVVVDVPALLQLPASRPTSPELDPEVDIEVEAVDVVVDLGDEVDPEVAAPAAEMDEALAFEASEDDTAGRNEENRAMANGDRRTPIEKQAPPPKPNPPRPPEPRPGPPPARPPKG